jgi:hypothetical protein
MSQKRFTPAYSLTKATEDFRSTTDPIAIWLDRHTIEDSGAYVAKGALHVAYNDSAGQAGRVNVSANAFGRAIKRLRPKATERQRKIGGRTVWVYLGLGFLDSRDSRDSL